MGTELPGSETPGQQEDEFDYVTVHTTGAAIDSTTSTEVGEVVAGEVVIKDVWIDPTQSDFEFNIELGGTDVFGSEQTVDDTNEDSYQPDQNTRVGGYGTTEVAIDVSDASSTGSATTDVSVLLATRNRN